VDYINRLYDKDKTGVEINLERIVVKDLLKSRDVSFDEEKISDDRDDILRRDDIDIVVELIGGYEPSLSIILESIERGKDVVTANKAVLAKYGYEIFSKARRLRRNIGFQASVCGEMRVLDILFNIPSFKDVEAILGIVNGTSNYILSRMEDGESYYDALEEAYEKGYAERDPSLDVEGIDAAQKLSLLSSIVFGIFLDFEGISREGISRVTKSDIKYAKTFGYVIRPLAIAKRRSEGIELRVHPTLVPETHPLAAVRDENNALSIYFYGRKEPLTVIGKGAGEPAARSIVADIVDVARKRSRGLLNLPRIEYSSEKSRVMSVEEFETPYCLRFFVEDKPGTLGNIALILGNYGINISGVAQVPEDKVGDIMPLAIKVDSAGDEAIYKALKEIRRLDRVKEILPIRIYE
jgi:homoserine dehydrogenase